MYRLVIEDRDADREPLVVRDVTLTIGRDSACRLRLAAHGVSDRHAVIERRRDGWYIRDLQSANGVLVNGRPVAEHRLLSDDQIEIGCARLRFEILHTLPERRRRLDGWQILAALLIAMTIAGQFALIAWIISEPRPRHLRVSTQRLREAAQAALTAPGPAEIRDAPTVAPQTPLPAPAPAPSAAPAVLNRMIRIANVERRDRPDNVTLTIRAVAQVGERNLDVAATAIVVQFFNYDPTGQVAPAADPLWLTIGHWENFTAKTFSARLPGPPSMFAGYVIRAYYRGRLQDVLAAPPALLPLAPDPLSPS
jgi:hypothetical protein